MRASWVILVTVMASNTVTALAQRPLVSRQLDSGAVVRMTFSTGRREVGRLIAPFGPDSVLLRYCPYLQSSCPVSGDRRTQVPAMGVARLDVRQGTHSRTGAILGAVLSVPLMYVGFSGLEQNLSGWRAAGLVAVGVVCSTGWGALVGSWLDAWKPALPRTL